MSALRSSVVREVKQHTTILISIYARFLVFVGFEGEKKTAIHMYCSLFLTAGVKESLF